MSSKTRSGSASLCEGSWGGRAREEGGREEGGREGGRREGGKREGGREEGEDR